MGLQKGGGLIQKIYNHNQTEDKIYSLWEKSTAFVPSSDPGTKPFTIIMPPPNANDPLHIGHAMFVTVEDILIRFHRMRGDATLWLPGTDHAGIETQFVYEKKLKKESKSRFDFDRVTLYRMIWDYVQENSGVAVNQMKKLGASADWSRFKFTLDPDIVSVVIHTFKKLQGDGLLYRDYRLVNYCTRCGTGFSELEVMHEIRKDPLIYMKYGPFVIATVRPETKFRDTALAVHPDDPRYRDWIGKTIETQGLLGPFQLTIIPDPEVNPEFGTGIMKVTPAHDFHDFELGKKHNLPITPIINTKGKMDFSWFLKKKDIAEEYRTRALMYHSLHVSKARLLMIQHLKEDRLIEKTDENYEHTVGVCYRCGNLLEPLPLVQFFIRVTPLAQKALKVLQTGEVKIHGPGYDKILIQWLKNLKDWNISRQIVWGIRIPVWYSFKKNPDLEISFLDTKKALRSGKIKEFAGVSIDEIRKGLQELRAPLGAEYNVAIESPGEDYLQETDTFDTWFSSAQWPFATLMTNKPGDFERFYPTQVMETAYDILIFWVMRMLMIGLYRTGKAPFADVYLHGLIRDEKGQKMSKSKGNVLNPLDVVEKYGADALRMALVMSTTAGKDSSTSQGKIRGMRNLTNKVWNAARFVITHPDFERVKHVSIETSTDFDAHLSKVVKTVTQQLDNLKVGLAAETVYDAFWHWFCDECIEQTKQGQLAFTALYRGLEVFLKLMHPFMPFVTEEIWQLLQMKTLLIREKWPSI